MPEELWGWSGWSRNLPAACAFTISSPRDMGTFSTLALTLERRW